MADQLIVGIDIGSTKFSSAVALYNRSGRITYLGHGSTPSAGMKGGRISDPEALARAMRLALDEVRHLTGSAIQDLVISVAGAQMAPIERHGQVRLDAGYPIGHREVEQAIEAAFDNDPEGLKTVHRVVQGFSVHGQATRSPIGRHANDLDVYVRDFAVTTELVEGIRQAAASLGMRVHAFVPGGVAAGEAALTQEERENGVVLIDIGGATTDVASYIDGDLHDVSGFPLGGHHLTQDIAAVLEVSLEAAERLKRRDGIATSSESSRVPVDWGPRGIARIQRQARDGTLSADVVRAIAGARLEQILQRARDIALRTDGHNGSRHGSIVVTGGSSNLKGIEEAAAEVFGLPARRGEILPSTGFPPIADPASSTSVGLVRYCASRGAWAADSSSEEGWPPEPVRAGHGRNDEQSRWNDAPLYTDVRRDASRAQSSGGRDWGQFMRNWMREFIPARSDA